MITYTWKSIKDELPPLDDMVLFCCIMEHYLTKENYFTEVDCGIYTGKKTMGEAVIMYYTGSSEDDTDWSPCSHWTELPSPPEIA